MGEYTKIEELLEEVQAERLVVVRLLDLRDMLGYKRLGTRVLVDIARVLRASGLGYFPLDVLSPSAEEPRQWDQVRVFEESSKLGRIIAAIQDPDEESDSFLLEVADSEAGDAAVLLDQIRTLLGA